jgi:hypothetical protein
LRQNISHKLLLRSQLAGMCGKNLHEFKFGGSQVGFDASNPDLMHRDIDDEIAAMVVLRFEGGIRVRSIPLTQNVRAQNC